MRNTHDVGLGMLHVADEARGHFLGVETEEGRVAPEKRHEIQPIRNLVVAVGLDHRDVVRRQMSLGGDLLAGQTFALAALREQLAERRIRRGVFRTKIRSLEFGFGFLVSHLRSPLPAKGTDRRDRIQVSRFCSH